MRLWILRAMLYGTYFRYPRINCGTDCGVNLCRPVLRLMHAGISPYRRYIGKVHSMPAGTKVVVRHMPIPYTASRKFGRRPGGMYTAAPTSAGAGPTYTSGSSSYRLRRSPICHGPGGLGPAPGAAPVSNSGAVSSMPERAPRIAGPAEKVPPGDHLPRHGPLWACCGSHRGIGGTAGILPISSRRTCVANDAEPAYFRHT